MNNINKVVALVFFILFYLFIQDLYISIGLSLALYYILSFISSLGKQIPILELMILLALLQWVVGPYIDYITPATHFKYFMYVSQDEYFSVVVPSLITFILPTILLKSKIDLGSVEKRIRLITGNNKKLPWTLIVIGFLGDFLSPFSPPALSFVLFILSQFKYIGLIYMFFSDVKYDKYLMYFIFGLTVLSSIRSGMFHDLILWSALFLTFIVHKYKWNNQKKIGVILIGLLFSIITQSIKSEYREIIYENRARAGIDLFVNLAYDKIIGGGLFGSEESINELNVRLNQGWIISAIIENVPSQEPYANGETIEDAIVASLVPRVLDSDKKEAGGRENFMRFTGLPIMTSTSMGTSILGEAYANYGPEGTIVFMFLWGFAVVLIFNLMVKFSLKYPSILLWLPLIFLQALKAETELVVVLNHIVKSAILIFAFFWFATKTLKWRL